MKAERDGKLQVEIKAIDNHLNSCVSIYDADLNWIGGDGRRGAGATAIGYADVHAGKTYYIDVSGVAAGGASSRFDGSIERADQVPAIRQRPVGLVFVLVGRPGVRQHPSDRRRARPRDRRVGEQCFDPGRGHDTGAR